MMVLEDVRTVVVGVLERGDDNASGYRRVVNRYFFARTMNVYGPAPDFSKLVQTIR